MNKNLSKLGVYSVSIFFLVLLGFPFVFLLITTFKTQMEYMMELWSLPKSLYLENYANVAKSGFIKYFFNSAIVSTVSVSITILAGSLAGYCFATMKFKLNKPLFMMFLVGMMIPVHTTLIPIYSLTNKLGLLDKLPGLIGPYSSFAMPVAIFIMTGFFKDIPASIQESAVMDGASPFTIFFKVMLPLSVPAIATVGIYNFLASWNEFIYSLTIMTRTKTLPLGLREFYGAETINIPLVLTAVLIASLPVMLFYLFAQEKVINGLSAGAVKG